MNHSLLEEKTGKLNVRSSRLNPIRLYYEPIRVSYITPWSMGIEIYENILIGRDEFGKPYVIGEFVRAEKRGPMRRGVNYYFKETNITIDELTV